MRVLVVDDDPMICRVVQFVFDEAGYEVSTAQSAREAWSNLDKDNADLVILDVLMPETDGFELYQRLREHNFGMPIIFLSVRNELAAKLTGFDLGADDYIIKPFEPAELLARARSVLKRYKQSSLPMEKRIHRVGGMELDTSELRIILPNGESVGLTPTETKILAHLMQNVGHVVMKESLIENVWGYESENESNELAVYIGRLRRKLGQDSTCCERIEVIRGVGYRFKRE